MKDNVGVRDQVMAGLETKVIPAKHPCPSCGKAMKDANTKMLLKVGHQIRICVGCRMKADWSSGKPEAIDEVAIAQLEVDAMPLEVVSFVLPPPGPEHPCPQCGKAMKDANTVETKEAGLDLRICSSRICRARAEWSTGKAVPYNG